MKLLKVIYPFVILLTTSSCVFSLFPIYTEDSIIYLPELVGKWQMKESDEDEYILFEGDTTERSYKMTVKSDGDSISYKVHIANIGDNYFLDLYPSSKSGYVTSSEQAMNFIPVHTFMKITLEKNELKIIQFDLGKLIDLFESNRIRVRHETTEEYMLITAKPKEIQKFLKRYSGDESVFETPGLYYRAAS